MSDDLWGNLDNLPNIKSPRQILLEQAALLREKTKAQILGDVETWTYKGIIFNRLNAVVPALDNYAMSIVTTSHAAAIYPVTIESSLVEVYHEADDEQQLMRSLSSILSSEKVHRALALLLSQTSFEHLPRPASRPVTDDDEIPF